MADTPVVAISKLWLDPNQAALVREAPRIYHLLGLEQKGVGRPKVQVSVGGGNLGDWKGGNRVESHRAVMVLCRSSACGVFVLPWWVGVDGSEPFLRCDQVIQKSNTAARPRMSLNDSIGSLLRIGKEPVSVFLGDEQSACFVDKPSCGEQFQER